VDWGLGPPRWQPLCTRFRIPRHLNNKQRKHSISQIFTIFGVSGARFGVHFCYDFIVFRGVLEFCCIFCGFFGGVGGGCATRVTCIYAEVGESFITPCSSYGGAANLVASLMPPTLWTIVVHIQSLVVACCLFGEHLLDLVGLLSFHVRSNFDNIFRKMWFWQCSGRPWDAKRLMRQMIGMGRGGVLWKQARNTCEGRCNKSNNSRSSGCDVVSLCDKWQTAFGPSRLDQIWVEKPCLRPRSNFFSSLF